MNVQLFGGKSREEANQKIVKDNFQAEVGKEYSIDYKEGILVVAYPNKDQETDFEFTYWIGGYDEPGFFDFEGENGELNFIIVCVVGVLIILLCLIGCFCCSKRLKSNSKVNTADKVQKFEELPETSNDKI